MYHCQVKVGSKEKGASATKHADYIMREGDYAIPEGKSTDLQHVGYGNMPSFADGNASEMWRLSDKYEGANRTVYRELELGFPLGSKLDDQKNMVEKLMLDKFKGHAFTYAIHDKEGNPHAHVMFCDRKQDGIERTAEQFFKRADKKHPEKGGCGKADELNSKDRGKHVEKIREQWASIHNYYFESIGSPEREDHRTLVAQRDEAIEQGDMKKAALLNRPAAMRISRKEWFRLQHAGELEQVQEERAASKELAQANAELVGLKLEQMQQRKAAKAATQDVVTPPKLSKSEPPPVLKPEITKIQEVVKRPEANLVEDPRPSQGQPPTTTSSQPVIQTPVSSTKPLPVVPEAPSEAHPPLAEKNKPTLLPKLAVDSALEPPIKEAELTDAELEELKKISKQIAYQNSRYMLREQTESQFDLWLEMIKGKIRAIIGRIPGMAQRTEINYGSHDPLEIDGKGIQKIIDNRKPKSQPAQTQGRKL